MVFTGPQFESGFSNTFVIEASTSGVDLTNLRDYIADKSTFLAIKRVKEPWFDEIKQSRVRGLLLDKIKSTYDYWAIGHLARTLWFGVEKKVRGEKHAIAKLPAARLEAAERVHLLGPRADRLLRGRDGIHQGEPAAGLDAQQVVFHKEALSRLPQTDEDWSYLDARGSQGRRRHVL